MNPLVELQAYGQSFWYDNIRRKFLQDGTLHSLINDHLYERSIPLKDKIHLLIITVNQMFNVPDEKIQKLLIQTEQIINENKITILDYTI